MQPSLIDSRSIVLHPGERPIPGFRLIRRRGRGGFGEVWEVEGPGGFPIALKFVRMGDQAPSAEMRALDIVREIRHPNLLTSFGAWLVDDTLIIGMELADGSLWDRHLAATREGYRGIPRSELLGYLAGVAAGIDHLNGARHTVDGRSSVGIQHRDLKPTNILLFGGGAKVADLGMARAMHGEVAGHTGTWTIPYAAPEFFRGETTRQSDQYSLAVTYCQLRGGRLPFSGSAATIAGGHLFGRPDLDALPEPERAVVERGLAKEARERWPDCGAFVAALRALPDDAVADILIDSDAPTAGLDGLSEWTDVESANLSGLTTDSAWSTDSEWLLDSTGAIGIEATGSAPTLILPTDPAAHRPHRVGDRPWRRWLRGSAIAGATALALTVVALRRPGSVPATHPTPATPIERIPAPKALAVASDEAAAFEPHLAAVSHVKGEAVTPSAEASRESPWARPPDAISPVVATAPTSLPNEATAGPPELILEGPIGMDVVAAIVARSPVASPGPIEPLTRPSEIPPVEAVLRVAAPRADQGPPTAAAPVAPAPPAVVPDRSAAEAAFARGRAAFARHAFAQAIPDLTETLRLDPAHVPSHLLRGIARHRGGDPQGALADYDAVLVARPNDATTAVSRGQAHHDLADYVRAEADYTAALRLRPEDSDAHFRRGLTRFQASDYAGAVGDFNETLRLDRNHLYANEFRAEALARRDARLARPGAATPPPAATDRAIDRAGAPTLGPTTQGGSVAPLPVRETAQVAPPRAATSVRPAPRPTNATANHRGPLRRLLPWPWPRGR